jgi:H+-translocating NAD(P) transhydrogenase subunit alpha
MRIGAPEESGNAERRVALIPETVKRLAKMGLETSIQAGAGRRAGFSDAEYAEAGAKVCADGAALVSSVDLLVQIQPPTSQEISRLRPGMTLVTLLSPLLELKRVMALRDRKVSAISLDSVPRTTLAQMMDVLSSQATSPPRRFRGFFRC